MSGLEKFQSSEAWRTNFKKFLFMERKPEIVQNTLKMTESQRYSLDIGEDLKSIIEQKKNKKTINLNEEVINTSNVSPEGNRKSDLNKSDKENMDRYNETIDEELPGWQKTSDKSFEALEKMCDKTISDNNNTLFRYLNSDCEQKVSNVLNWQKTSDESFEALERMCDKTASDPNSTLFQYLHSESKERVLEEIKRRNEDGMGISSHNCEDQLLMRINNCTLLDDVEAPSRMWENSICGDTILKTSPVKMIGLLRPSTIIEEAPDDSANSDLSSHMSFRTATKSDVTSSAYETAHDATATSSQTDFSNKFHNQKLEVKDVDKILFTSLEKNEQKQEATVTPALEKTCSTIDEPEPLYNNCKERNYSSEDISVDLIDLEKTFGSPQCSVRLENCIKNKEGEEIESAENQIDDSVIEILSDDEENEVEDGQNIDAVSHNEHYMKTEILSSLLDTHHDTYNFDGSHEDNKENWNESQNPSEKSTQFNDTMEEVEYMMKKGMEYMAAKVAHKKTMEDNITPMPQAVNRDIKPQHNSPIKCTKVVKPLFSSASKAKSSIYSTPAKKITPIKSDSLTSKRFDINIKPFPKFDIFLKPQNNARSKELTSKQQKFSHIVSPIGTYMKKTAQTPLMSSINCKTENYFNSTAIQELENESRLYQPHLPIVVDGGDTTELHKLPGLASGAKRALPKKAYISSDLKHIVYERTPVTIPGGKKIQKYLENAMMPAVLRHEGKFKITGGITSPSSGAQSKLPLQVTDTNSTVTKPTTDVPRRNNVSLADLSLMSGDISMYTIMDAKKF